MIPVERTPGIWKGEMEKGCRGIFMYDIFDTL
jgi:hypothetical protein